MFRYSLMLALLLSLTPAWAEAVSPGTGVAERLQRVEERRRERLERERALYHRRHGTPAYSQPSLEAQRAAERARQQAEWRRAVDEKARPGNWLMHGSNPNR